jgi:thiamine kinase-like enzyme
LHGDLWTTNIFVMPGEKLRARLIDWDHIGVGQVTYDLSTYLLRFPMERRQSVLDCYQAAIEPMNWELPAAEHFNLLCETAELSRLATATLWSAINVGEHHTDWAFAELNEISQWFEALQPLLPVAPSYEQASRN